MKSTITITLDVEHDDNTDVYSLVEDLLDAGTLQDALAENARDHGGELKVTSSTHSAQGHKVPWYCGRVGDANVTVLFRPPMAGERGYSVPPSANPAQAWDLVVDGMDGAQASDFGWKARVDHPEYDSDGDRVVTVQAQEVK